MIISRAMQHVHVCSPLFCVRDDARQDHSDCCEGVMPDLTESGDAAWIGCNHLARQARIVFFVEEVCKSEGAEGVLG